MAEKLTTLPHDFDYIEDERANLTLVGQVRLDPVTNVVMLKATNGLYPADGGDNYVISALFTPNAVRSWAGFQSFVVNQFATPTIQSTGDLYRLSDGTSHWWWNGAAWAITTTQWNVEADIANNISVFSTASKQLAVVVKLTTTDPLLTPTIQMVRIAWIGKLDTFEDMIYRTLVPLFKLTRIIVDFAIKVPMPGGLTLDVLTPVKAAKNQFNVVDVDSIFNFATDPDTSSNLLSSYNATTGLATLTTAIPVGTIALVKLVIQPQVAVKNTSYDYDEVELAPSIQITGIEAVNSQPQAIQTGIVNKATGVSITIQPPYRFNLRFTMIALAPGGVDLTRTLSALVELVENNPLVTSKATGEQNRFWMIDEFTDTTQPTSNNLHELQATFEVLDILTFKKPALAGQAVMNINLNTSNG